MNYFWIKALHIISFIAWYAGMFYIWRLFVYHAESAHQETKNTFVVMERKLLRIIMWPASILTTIFGVWMLVINWVGFSPSFWIWIKIGLVVVLFGLQYLAEIYRKKLLEGKQYNSKLFRILNEVPTLILFGIVILAVLKPV